MKADGSIVRSGGYVSRRRFLSRVTAITAGTAALATRGQPPSAEDRPPTWKLLLLNAALPSPERLFARDSACVMVGVVDNKGVVSPGFEAGKCVVRNEDRRDIPLRWGSAFARTLAGRTVRLGFHLRGTSLCAVTAGTTP